MANSKSKIWCGSSLGEHDLLHHDGNTLPARMSRNLRPGYQDALPQVEASYVKMFQGFRRSRREWALRTRTSELSVGAPGVRLTSTPALLFLCLCSSLPSS